MGIVFIMYPSTEEVNQMEYKGNITLPTYTEYCDSLLSNSAKEDKKVKCQNCEGHGTIVEDVQSSQGNWHEIEEDCEECDGDGEVCASELSSSKNIVSTHDYKVEMIETVRKLSSWTRTDFFLNIAKCKALFIKGGYHG
ncbi:heat shock protein DnaJ [Vibrio phage 1.135.O._10N.222.54.B6]|nr:heat shock protein DnaJ [Vibrio phage 1.135.O._10N.222.54.B6]